ncbi:MAG: DeoR family transcriptional regulator [Candidatus Sungbacteria bacterium]|nr:DeoR family transcriptional regulator [Candidatus Sungbacteria bacterium]
MLRRRPRVTVGELGALFSGRVSKKTLQRDLQDLSDRDVVKRTGERRWTAYSLNA